MFRITEDPSSGSLVQCWPKNYKNVSIVSVDMDKVGVMAAYADCVCISLYRKALMYYTHVQRVTICCHNTDLVHVNRHDRNILVIFRPALYKAP